MVNPVSRANYEPNSLAAPKAARGRPGHRVPQLPSRRRGTSAGCGQRASPIITARPAQFFSSQTEVEQQHIADAFAFELSKCDRADIRTRMVAGLRNVDEDLAHHVAGALGLDSLPDAAPAARAVTGDLPVSPALSILRNGPQNFAGRKIGVLVTESADAA